MVILKAGYLSFVLGGALFFFCFLMALTKLNPDTSQLKYFSYMILDFLISTITGGLLIMAFNFINYYKYQVGLEDKSLTYSYGHLSKVEFRLPLNYINEVYIHHSLSYRAFKYYELNVSVI